MAGLKDLRNRLSSVKSTEKITTAMKLVAAAKLKKAQTALEKNNAYALVLENAVGRILASYKRDETEKKVKHKLLESFEKEQNFEKYLLVVFSSERGLCGSYNQNVVKAASKHIKELQKQNKEVKLVCFGKKAYDILKKKYADLIVCYEPSFASGGIYYEEANEMVKKVVLLDKEYSFDTFEIVYSLFKSAAIREIKPVQIWPIDMKTIHVSEDLEHVGHAYYDFKPSREVLFKQAIIDLEINRVYRAMLSAEASEQSARMIAMDNATQNAQDMISDLTLQYNTLRQSAITTELNEIISGAEAI